MSAFAQRALIGVGTPDPRFTGDALLGNWHLCPAPPNTRPCILLASGTQAPTGVKFEKFCAVRTPPTLAKPWQLGNDRCPTDHRRTKQVGTQEAAYVSVAMPSNFDGNRPQWAESSTETDLDFARREHT